MPEEKALSEREKDVLRLVALGLTNREIGQELAISPNTVKVHLSNIYEKVGVVSRTEATVYAIEHRIVEVPGGETVGEQQQPRAWRQLIGVWIAIGLLVIIILFTFFINAFPSTFNNESQPTADLSERWTELSPMPEPRIGSAAVSSDGRIYIIAGEGPEGVSGTVFRYDPDEDIWKTMSPKPTPVTEVQGVLIGEKIYIPGGRDKEGHPVSTLEIYDPRQDRWMTGASLPESLANCALADFEGLLYLFGGTDGQEAQDSVWVYDPKEDAWQSGTSMISAREGASAVVLTDRIVILGGRNNTELLKSTQSYFPSRDTREETPWEHFVDMPLGRAEFGATSINDLVYILGGEMEGEGESGLVLVEDNWVSLSMIEDFSSGEPRLISIGQLLYVLVIQPDMSDSAFWSYQAFYYSIFIPILQ